MSYIGNTPGVSSQRLVTSYIATAGQTSFVATGGYVRGYLDVYLNGVKLSYVDDFTATDGVNVVLSIGASAGDTVELVAYIPRGLSDGYTKAEADAKYVELAGDTMTDSLGIGASALDISKVTGRSYLSVRGTGTSANDSAGVISMVSNKTTNDTAIFPVGNIEWHAPGNSSSGSTRIAYITCGTTDASSNTGSFLEFATKEQAVASGGITKMSLTSKGVLKKPYHPSFSAVGMPSNFATNSNGSSSKVTWNSPIINVSNSFASSRFTAPEAGIYNFYAYGLLLGSNTNVTLEIRKNGAVIHTGRTKSSIENYVSVAGLVSLAASDYVEIYANSDGGISCTVYNGFAGFSGYLLG